MADNLSVTPGSGATVATKDQASVHHQKAVAEFFVSGVPTVVDSSNPLPVQQAALSPTVDQVSLGANVSGGWTPGRLVSAATTNATSVKASAGQVGFLYATNVNAAIRYLKLYNKASAPTVGTDTPVLTIGIPGAGSPGAGGQLAVPAGIAFTTGIAFALTTEAADAGTTAVAVNEIVLSYGWK